MGVGEGGEQIVDAATRAGFEGDVVAAADAADAADRLATLVADGDAILVKASRGVGLDAVVSGAVENGVEPVIPVLIKTFQEPLESTGLITVLRVFYQVEFRAFLAVLVAFGLVLWFGPRTIAWLMRQKVGDAPEFNNAGVNELMRARAGTPTMGGILICGAILASVILLADLRERYVHIALAVVISFGLIGMADDWLKLTTARRTPGARDGLLPWEKLLFQVGLAAMFSWVIFTQATVDDNQAIQDAARVLNLPFQRTFTPNVAIEDPMLVSTLQLGTAEMITAMPPLDSGVIVLGVFAFVLLGTLVIAGTSNAVNISDGMDGLAAGVMAIAAVAFMIIVRIGSSSETATDLLVPYVHASEDLMVVAGAMAGACLGFLWFNSSPAKVFMGDTGSLSLGALLRIPRGRDATGDPAGPGRRHLLPRAAERRRPGRMVQVHRIRFGKGVRILRCSPIHHHFHLGGWSEQQVVTRFWLVTIVLSMAAFALIKLRLSRAVATRGPASVPPTRAGRPGTSRGVRRLGMSVTTEDGDEFGHVRPQRGLVDAAIALDRVVELQSRRVQRLPGHQGGRRGPPPRSPRPGARSCPATDGVRRSSRRPRWGDPSRPGAPGSGGSDR